MRMRVRGDSRLKTTANAVVVICALTITWLTLPGDVAWANTDADVADPWEGMNRGIFRFNEGGRSLGRRADRERGGLHHARSR